MRFVAPAVLGLTLLMAIALRGNDEPNTAAAAERPHVKKCDSNSAVKRFTPRPGDARLGRALLVSFRHLFENAEADEVYQPEPGLFVLKAALVFSGKRDLTISVDPSVAGVLRLDYEWRSDGYGSVRFRSCASRTRRATGHPGALNYTGPWPACVPIQVAVGDRAPKRYLLSFGAGRCKSPG